MARPRVHSDTEILDAIGSALAGRLHSGTWTLAEVAPAAGLSPAGILKRFGSRSGLQRAMWERWFSSIPTAPLGAFSPETELREYLSQAFGFWRGDDDLPATRGAELAGQWAIAALLDDLRAPESAELLQLGWDRQTDYCAQLLARMDLVRLADPRAGASLLMNACVGGLFRGGEQHMPHRILNELMQGWN